MLEKAELTLIIMLSKTKKVITTHLIVLCSVASRKLFYSIAWRVGTLSLQFVPPAEGGGMEIIMKKIKIGQITGAVGLKGEFKVYDYGEDVSRYRNFEAVYIDDTEYRLKSARTQKNMAVLLLEEIDSRDKAEKLRGKNIYIDEAQLPELPEGVYYIKDLIGFDVVSDEGVHIGTLEDILKNTAQPLYKVKTEKGSVYIPGVDEYILNTDIAGRTITVKLIEGLLDL